MNFSNFFCVLAGFLFLNASAGAGSAPDHTFVVAQTHTIGAGVAYSGYQLSTQPSGYVAQKIFDWISPSTASSFKASIIDNRGGRPTLVVVENMQNLEFRVAGQLSFVAQSFQSRLAAIETRGQDNLLIALNSGEILSSEARWPSHLLYWHAWWQTWLTAHPNALLQAPPQIEIQNIQRINQSLALVAFNRRYVGLLDLSPQKQGLTKVVDVWRALNQARIAPSHHHEPLQPFVVGNEKGFWALHASSDQGNINIYYDFQTQSLKWVLSPEPPAPGGYAMDDHQRLFMMRSNGDLESFDMTRTVPKQLEEAGFGNRSRLAALMGLRLGPLTDLHVIFPPLFSSSGSPSTQRTTTPPPAPQASSGSVPQNRVDAALALLKKTLVRQDSLGRETPLADPVTLQDFLSIFPQVRDPFHQTWALAAALEDAFQHNQTAMTALGLQLRNRTFEAIAGSERKKIAFLELAVPLAEAEEAKCKGTLTTP